MFIDHLINADNGTFAPVPSQYKANTITVLGMASQAFRDPGILPRNLDPEPPYSSATASDQTPTALPRDIKVRAGM